MALSPLMYDVKLRQDTCLKKFVTVSVAGLKLERLHDSSPVDIRSRERLPTSPEFLLSDQEPFRSIGKLHHTIKKILSVTESPFPQILQHNFTLYLISSPKP